MTTTASPVRLRQPCHAQTKGGTLDDALIAPTLRKGALR
jgi:hypothetical protein